MSRLTINIGAFFCGGFHVAPQLRTQMQYGRAVTQADRFLRAAEGMADF